MRDLLKNLHSASKLSDCIEARVDNVHDFSMPPLLNQKIIPAIFTCYSKTSGGFFSGNENKRLKLLSSAITSGKFKYITIDIPDPFKISAPVKSLLDLALIRKTGVILSHHNFKNTDDDLETIYQRLNLFKPTIIKMVTYARNFSDNFKLFNFARKITSLNKFKNPKLISFCMGENGLVSRILYKKFGLFMTYASYKENTQTADGQIPFSRMKYIYHADSLNSKTRIFGLIGYPINHSLSPLFFNSLFGIKHLNAVYLPFAIEPIHFARDFSLLSSFLKIDGYSVTIPYKMKVMKLANRLDTVAGEIKAVNTVYRRNNKLIGTNTDWLGVSDALAPLHKNLQSRQALILGNGGAARAVKYALDKMGIKSIMFSRHHKNRNALAWHKIPQYCQGEEKDKIIINATPVGMFPDVDKSPVKKSLIKKRMLVFDVIYNPLETKLIKYAKAKGCQVINGLDMFIFQAMEQFKYFSRTISPKSRR